MVLIPYRQVAFSTDGEVLVRIVRKKKIGKLINQTFVA